jgi:Winged helix DNA-binding domain
LLRRRLATQLLTDRSARSPVEVTRRLLAVQAQDLRGAALTVRSRSIGLHSRDLRHALAERRLLITWLNRGTLHLVEPADYWWLQAVTTPQLRTGSRRRLQQEGVSPAQAARGVALIESTIAAQGPQTRNELRVVLADAGVPVAGQALVHLLMASALDGVTVRGPMVGREQAFVLVRDWLGPPPPRDPEGDLPKLALRYLGGHAPATAADLARWAGISLGRAQAGLRAVAGTVDLGEGLVTLADRPEPDAGRWPTPRLLGPFEPSLLGWTSRTDILGTATAIVTKNGIFKPFVMVRGRAIGTWSMPAGRVAIDYFGSVSARDRAALEADAGDVESYFDRDQRIAGVQFE